MSYNRNGGQRRLRVTPYLTCIGPRKIGDIPSQYVIRSPSSSENMKTKNTEPDGDDEPPPVLQHFSEEVYGEPTTSGESESIQNEDSLNDDPKNTNIAGLQYEQHEVTHKMDSLTETERRIQRQQKDLRFAFPMVYVEAGRRWTYKPENHPVIEDGQLFYAPNPFLPVPPSRGAPCAAVRMYYAANRIDSIKYRGQHAVVSAAKQRNMESANCEKCNMRFFLPFNHMRSHISYSETDNRFDLPLAHFRCPLCRHENQIIEFNKEFY